MEETKMSEDDSVNEVESDEESSSESVDEEIKLSQNFITVLQKISSDSKNYEDYILLLDIAHDLNDLDKIRQSIELFSKEFPLSPELWMKYLKTEVIIAQTEEEIDNLIKVFKKALDDYYSVDIALEYASLTSRCSDKQAKEIWDDLIPVFGYDYWKGRLIWKAWRDDYMKRETDQIEMIRKVVKKFKEELLLPLHEMQLTYVEFREFLEKFGDQLQKPFDREAFEVEVKDTKKILQKVKPFESKLSKLDNKAHHERVETFKNYVDECSELEEEYVQVLYERMITACCLNETVWKAYIEYIQNRASDWAPLESNKSKIFLQTDLDIVNRGLRNCNWSADLYIEKIRILETKKETKEKVQLVLEEATQVQYKSPDPLVKVWIEYLTYLVRSTNFNEEKETEILRNNFNLAWNSLGWQFGNLADCDCEILKFWGRIEYSKLNDHNQGKQLWNTVMESNDNYLKTALWIEYAKLEHQYKGTDAARWICKRALKVHDLNDVPSMVSFWLRFERCHGTLESLKACQSICEKVLKQHNRKFSSNKRKSDNFSKEKDKEPNENKRKLPEDENPQHKKKFKEDTKEAAPKYREQEKAEEMEIDTTKDHVRVFLSNLDITVTLKDLQDTFPEINVVNFNMIAKGKGKTGFGYAELASEVDVRKALRLDRRLLSGRPVFISPCERDKTHRAHGFKYSTNIEPKKLFVKGLSYSAENDDLQKLFGPFGKIVDIRIVMNKFGKKKGCAYIEFEEEGPVKKAVMKLDQIEFMGKKITVAISEPPKPDSKAPQPPITQNSKQMIARTEQKSRISFIPASVQKSNLTASAPPSSQPAMSNDDFRKLISK
ncbi:unnamed protein product [Chironomus riparius]|uniref:RRM domain-containing protein n=1 Tax=Chironomus riparius TaxID=315576 RepID=A0A9N9S5J2_9DIPT|nr:unnamed protein product [Chironomus riparius]